MLLEVFLPSWDARTHLKEKNKNNGRNKKQKNLAKTSWHEFYASNRHARMSHGLHLSVSVSLFKFPSMPLAWSPSLCHDYHAIGMVTMLMAGSSCLGNGHYAFGRVSVPLVGSPRLWLGHHAFGRVITPLVWSPWLWDGFHTFGIVSMPALWSPRQRGPKRGVKESEILSKVSEGLSKVLRTCRRV